MVFQDAKDGKERGPVSEILVGGMDSSVMDDGSGL
jgi:hypothetical protein